MWNPCTGIGARSGSDLPVVGLPEAASVMARLGFRSMFSLRLYLGNKSLDSHFNQGRHTVGLVWKCIAATLRKKKNHGSVSRYNVKLSRFNVIIFTLKCESLTL